MTNWTLTALGLEQLETGARQKLAALEPIVLNKGDVIFRPGDQVGGFVMVLSGRVGVYLVGASGRELLLYAVTPGETCVQTTLGLLGENDYSGEAIAESDISAVMVPRALFLELMAESVAFRGFVFRAFADRLQSVMHVLEQVAFVTIEVRLARHLCDNVLDGKLVTTHQELATAIGTSREVISRKLESFAKQGLISLERGSIHIKDIGALRQMAMI